MKVLLAEEHDIHRAGIESLLGSDPDIEVVTSVSVAATALLWLGANKVDVALLDFDLMWEGDTSLILGLLNLYPNLPVVIFTAEPGGVRFTESLAWGANGYLTKCASRDELVQAVKTVGAGGSYIQPKIANLVLNAFRAPSPNCGPSLADVSRREREVLQLAAQGNRNQDIARLLNLSLSTVKTHFRSIYRKLDVSDRTHAVLTAVNLGLLQRPSE